MKRFTMTIHTVIVLLSLLLAAALLPGALAAPSIINTSGAVYTPTLCLSGVCQSSWPAGSGTSGGWTNTSTETRTLLNMTVQNGAVLFNGTTGSTPTSDAGTRMMWVPAKAAFRAGYVGGTHWDDANIGDYSVAIGYNTTANNSGNVALGYNASAVGSNGAVAIGYRAYANGSSAVAIGSMVVAAGGAGATAMGYRSYAGLGNGNTAIGYNAYTLGGNGATSIGFNNTVTGYYGSTALGYYTKASGNSATALGAYTEAAAAHSFAVGSGYVSGVTANYLTNSIERSIIFGFNSTTPTMFINGSAVGIGTTAPTSALHVNTTSSNVFVAYSNAFTNNAWDPVIEAKTYGNYALLGIGNAGNAHPGRIGLGGGTSNSGIQGDGGTVTLFSSAGGNITFGSDMYDTYDERMRITGDGKVGIGTTTPAAALHVNTSSSAIGTFMSTGGDVSLIIGTTAGSQRKGITYDDGTTADWVTFADAGYSPVPQFVIGTGSFYGVRRLVITDSGYVGIGHTDPAGQLHVHTNTSAANMYISANGTNSFARVWYVTDNSSAPWNVGARNDLTYGGGFSFETNNSGSWQSKLFITPGGNVGIGTTNPNRTLEVAGTIRASNEIASNLSGSSGQFRAVSGNYGTIFRNDGSDFYLLNTNSGDQYGAWNALRPFTINNANGQVGLGNFSLVVQHSGGVSIGAMSPGVSKLYVHNAGTNVGLYIGNGTPFGQAQLEIDGPPASHIWIAEYGTQKFTVTTGGAVGIYGTISMNSNKVTGLGTPTDAADAATKGYVDAAVAKTMYRTSATAAGNHNADDSPGSYCATGYHFCDTTEIYGRKIEVSGTGRSTTPGDNYGWLDGKGYNDCSDWASTSGNGIMLRNGYVSSGNDPNWGGTGVCSNSYPIWCCQD